MKPDFQPNGLAVLIGSLPLADHEEAVSTVLKYSPEIPLWVQLPVHKEERMMFQFLAGMPGLTIEDDKFFIDTSKESFQSGLVEFYEDYMAVSEGVKSVSDSRFVMTPETAKGFFVFKEKVKNLSVPPIALKGQITGPITLATGLKDHEKRAVFYNDQVRDITVKMIAMKAKWQIREMSAIIKPAIVFFDEPGLVGMGSSEFITISPADVAACFKEVIDAVHEEGGLAGIHVCANADWPLIFDSSADILSFDAYSFFDKLMLFAGHVRKFIESGRIIAWGIIPTLAVADIERENADSLMSRWENMMTVLSASGIDRKTVIRQSLITPSCGTGSLSAAHATKVLELTQEISKRIRKNNL